ncbi:MAG: hypothetical protein ACRBK7_14975, partial [Acidimicrobiales bacterium]
IVDTLVKMAGDADAEVRAYALMGLTYDLGLTDQIRPLLEAHLVDPDEKIREHARNVLDGTWT